MIKVLILICAMSVSPKDCTVHNAISVTNGPPVTNEIMCAMHGQAYLADTEIRPQEGEYVKITCTRSKNVPPNLG